MSVASGAVEVLKKASLFEGLQPNAVAAIAGMATELTLEEGDDVYTLGEHMTALTDAIWSELKDDDRKGTEAKPLINSFRRNLQRQHLDELMNLVLSEPGGIVPADANAIARLNVSDLSKKIGKRLDAGDIDIASRAHLMDIKTRIDKALEAQYTVDRYGSMGGLFFFRTAEQPAETLTVLPQN